MRLMTQRLQTNWVLWDWKARLYPLADAAADAEYALYGKLAESTVAKRYSGS
jgi:hypothetical protein